MPIAFSTSRDVPENAEVLGVPVTTDLAAADGSDLDVAYLQGQGFEGKVGQTVPLGPNGAGGAAVIAVGVGDASAADGEAFRRAAAALVRSARKRSTVATTLLAAAPGDLDVGAAARAIVEGAALAAYRYDEYRSTPDPVAIRELTLVGTGGKKLASGAERGEATARAVALARDLVNTPPGDLTPAAFAKRAEKVAAAAGVECQVIDHKEAKALGLGGLLGVGQGSASPPRMVKLTYTPETYRSTVAFVGKGITFDSGGLSIKTSEGMMTMKTDMSGAAAVLAAVSALATIGARTRVIGYLCLAENMPSGNAIRPSDVLRIRNSKTVEVLNTDAEGRLVLADGLSLAVEDEPDAIVDVATLTGACVVALGNKVAGLMGNHEGLVDQVQGAAARGGEAVWPLPLPADYRKLLESEVADVKNIGGGRYGGALTAGLFLKEFVGDVPWAHLDIAGPARSEEDEHYTPKGGTGAAVRTLIEVAAGFTKPKPRTATS